MERARKRAILLGMIIGDGYLFRRRQNNYDSWTLRIVHSSKQKAFLEHKAALLCEIYGSKPKIRNFSNSGYPGVEICKSDKYFRNLHNWTYRNREKFITRKILDWLTPEAISLWYMDDGSLSAKKRNGRIHAHELHLNTYCSKEECQVIVSYFIERWGISFTIVKNKGLYRVRCGTKEARKFFALVDDFIISSMKYKTTFKTNNPLSRGNTEVQSS